MVPETIMALERFVTYNLAQKNQVLGQNNTDVIYMRVMEWTVQNNKEDLEDVQYLLNMIVPDKKEQEKYIFIYVLLAHADSVKIIKVPAVTTNKLYKILGKVAFHSQFNRIDEKEIKDGNIFDSFYSFCVSKVDGIFMYEMIKEKLLNHHTKIINFHTEMRDKLLGCGYETIN